MRTKRKKGRRLLLLLVILAVAAAVFTARNGINPVTALRLRVGDYPESLVSLAYKNPEARQFVLDYPKNSGSQEPIDLSGEVSQGQIPLFLQWDERWGYETYGSDFLALTGCGPTCLSMVCCGLTGNTDCNPLYVARLSEQGGYYVPGAGTSWALMTEGALALGLNAQELPTNIETLTAALQAGMPVICSMGPGDFTDQGHFIVLTGIDDEGQITIADPNSPRKSSQSWEPERLMQQALCLWAYTPAA